VETVSFSADAHGTAWKTTRPIGYQKHHYRLLMERDHLMKPKEKSASMNQIAGELDIHDAMISSLDELLERKGILKQEEWEQNIKKQEAN
jgi:hypothetical protein